MQLMTKQKKKRIGATPEPPSRSHLLAVGEMVFFCLFHHIAFDHLLIMANAYIHGHFNRGRIVTGDLRTVVAGKRF